MAFIFEEYKLINNREAKTSAHPPLRKSRLIFVSKLIKAVCRTLFIRIRTTPQRGVPLEARAVEVFIRKKS